MFIDISSGNILSLITSNCNLNADWIKGNVSVQELNFYNDNYTDQLTAEIENSKVIIAADGMSLQILSYFDSTFLIQYLWLLIIFQLSTMTI